MGFRLDMQLHFCECRVRKIRANQSEVHVSDTAANYSLSVSQTIDGRKSFLAITTYIHNRIHACFGTNRYSVSSCVSLRNEMQLALNCPWYCQHCAEEPDLQLLYYDNPT